MARGYLLLLLHAHLPYVRHPEQPACPQERWLFEAISESYLPLLGALQRLAAAGVPCRCWGIRCCSAATGPIWRP